MELKNNKETFKSKFRKFYRSKLSVTRNELNGIHSAIRLTLLCGRIMGLLPLAGLISHRSHNVRFNLRSFYAVYYLGSILGQILMFVTTYTWIIHKGITVSNSTNAVFYISSLISSINLLNIGRRWPTFLRKVEEIESKLPPLPVKVVALCNMTMIFVLLAASVEHLLSVLYGLTVANSCDPEHVCENYFRQYMPWIFEYTPYTIWKGILIEIINIQSTFIWSYSDLIIMTISIYVTEHFITHNKLLKKAIYQAYFSSEDFREQHLRIVRLVELINEHIGIYIVTSFGSNLYWICTQLFFSLNTSQTGHFNKCENKRLGGSSPQGLEHTVYFTYSFSFIVLRSMLVLLLAARINSESIKPLVTLYDVPNNMFTADVERLIGQVKNIKVALSGLDFFYVTKTMILSLLGTIVTYELVLLQFNEQKE